MKKAFILILCLLMLIPLAACGEAGKPEAEQTASSTAMTLVIGSYDKTVTVTDEQLEAMKDHIELQLIKASVTGYTVTADAQNTVTVRLTERLTDDQIESLLVLPALTFRNEDGEIFIGGDSTHPASDCITPPAVVGLQNTGSADEPIIQLQLTETGTRLFADFTEANIGRHIGIYVDDELLFNPIVTERIATEALRITGLDCLAQADEACKRINAAILPFRLSVVSVD